MPNDAAMDTAKRPAAPAPDFSELLAVFSRIGVTSFGGPAGQIALMHKTLVDERGWIDEKRFLSALNFCMLLPGPEAMQLATYVGWAQHGVRGGLAAGLLFVLPGAGLMLVLSLVYALYGNVPLVAALFAGIKAAVLAIVVEALLRVSKRALKGADDWIVAALAFVAIFFFEVPFPAIVLAAALFGYLRAREAAGVARETTSHGALVPWRATAATIGMWLAIWIVPLLLVAAAFGPGHVLSQMALFFSKLAVVTFGGAYAVLAYMAQDVVDTYGWLKAGEMLDGLGLAETTPGPLILVCQFVGTIAAFREGGGPPVLMAILGAAVTLWATFAPCFLWVFAGAPYIEWLTHQPRLSSALRSVTASVVGVILNLTVWFVLHVLFRSTAEVRYGPLKLIIPDAASIDLLALALAAVAVVVLFVLHRGIMTTLAVCSALGLAASRIAG